MVVVVRMRKMRKKEGIGDENEFERTMGERLVMVHDRFKAFGLPSRDKATNVSCCCCCCGLDRRCLKTW